MPTHACRTASWLVAALVLLAVPLASAHASPPLAPDGPDAVSLEYFVGSAVYPNYILLEWLSVSEQDTQGYRLFRGVTPDPDQATLLVAFVAGHPGSPAGYLYQHPDSANLTPGVVYYYWIEDLDTNGVWNQHRDDPNLNPTVPWGCSRYDVVCNFVIDSQDIAAIAGHWNCAVGNSCYDAHFNLNGDSVIDVRDVMLAAARWGCQIGQVCYS